MEAPYRVVDAGFGPWVGRGPVGLEEEAMAPCGAARRAKAQRRAADPRLAVLEVEPALVEEVVYQHGHTREVLPLAEVEAEYGPVRPVGPPPDADVMRLLELVRAAGGRALGTLAAALYAVELRIGASGPQPVPEGGSDVPDLLMPADPLTAGRPGSREAMDFIDFVWTVGPTISGDRLDEELHREATVVFYRWATGPVFVEFAENIAEMLAPLIEDHGIASVADLLLLSEERIEWAISKTSL